MIEKLSGRDMVNTHAVAKKVNEIIDLLKEKDLIVGDEKNEKVYP